MYIILVAHGVPRAPPWQIYGTNFFRLRILCRKRMLMLEENIYGRWGWFGGGGGFLNWPLCNTQGIFHHSNNSTLHIALKLFREFRIALPLPTDSLVYAYVSCLSVEEGRTFQSCEIKIRLTIKTPIYRLTTPTVLDAGTLVDTRFTVSRIFFRAVMLWDAL